MKHIYFLLLVSIVFTTGLQAQLTPTYNDILIPMRDGEFLSADVYIPSNISEGEVILVQTPYNKNNFSISLPLGIGQNLDDQPFIWVIVDWRGFYGSAAAATSNPNRGEDAYDVCEWIVAQGWHKDRIGTWGPSALGKIQYDLAFQHHPNHTCAVPMVAHPQFAYDDFFYGGVLEEARLEQLDGLGYGLSPIIMANVYYSNTWVFAENSTWTPEEISIPTLQIGGWYDHNIDKMMDWYAACRAESTLPNEQYLLVGPWVHGGTGIAYVGSSVQGELTYPTAALVNNDMSWEFFNYYLLDSVNNWPITPKITYFETGKDLWNTSNASSIEETIYDNLYLSANNQLISIDGNGSTTFVCDPNNPAPTIGGATLHTNLDQGPYDQISLESRNDIITFATGDLPYDFTISGRVKCDLYVKSNQPDGDLMVHLVDVYPDGRNMLITDGAKRLRFRNGYTQALEAFMTPGTVYNVEVELPFTNYTWKAGHQLKIYIGGNSSIRWDVNLQNGGQMYVAGTANVANMTIHHNATYPSKIELPVDALVISVNEHTQFPVEVYPNPAKETLTVQSVQEFESYEIYDLNGRIVVSGDLKSTSISLEHITKGVYLLRLYNDQLSTTTRFVKE